MVGDEGVDTIVRVGRVNGWNDGFDFFRGKGAEGTKTLLLSRVVFPDLTKPHSHIISTRHISATTKFRSDLVFVQKGGSFEGGFEGGQDLGQ